MVTFHIFLAALFILCLISEVILVFFSDSENVVFGIGVFMSIMFFVAIGTGAEIGDKKNYRKNHKPTIEDVNSGYATIFTDVYDYDHDGKLDTVYSIEWNGTNKTGKRNVNYIVGYDD